MNTVTAHAPGGSGRYVAIWVWLLALTAVEVLLAYLHFFSTLLMLAILMFLSIIKAGLIMAYFMHLRSERVTLILTLLPAGAVVIGLLFVFLPDSIRLLEMRSR